MIKALLTAKEGDQSVFLFGLSEGNIERLREGKAIVVDLASMGRPGVGTVVITWGATEEAIFAQIAAAFDLAAFKPKEPS